MTKPNKPPAFTANTDTADSVPLTLCRRWNEMNFNKMHIKIKVLVLTDHSIFRWWKWECKQLWHHRRTRTESAMHTNGTHFQQILSATDLSVTQKQRNERLAALKQNQNSGCNATGSVYWRWARYSIRTICGMASSSKGILRPYRSTIHRYDILPNNPPIAKIEATIDASSNVSGPLGKRDSFVCRTRKFAGAQIIVSPNDNPSTFAVNETKSNHQIITELNWTQSMRYHKMLPKIVVELRFFPFYVVYVTHGTVISPLHRMPWSHWIVFFVSGEIFISTMTKRK